MSQIERGDMVLIKSDKVKARVRKIGNRYSNGHTLIWVKIKYRRELLMFMEKDLEKLEEEDE